MAIYLKFLALLTGSVYLCACSSRPILVSERQEKSELRDFSLQAYDEGVRFAEAGNNDVALERFQRSITIDPRPGAHFQAGKAQETLGQKEDAAESYFSALKLAPDYQEARFALLELGYKPPSEEEIKADPGAIDKFKEELEFEIAVRKAEAELAARELTPEQREALRARTRKQMAQASQSRIPTATEVKAALFPANLGQPEKMPSPDEPGLGDRDVILNTYAYHFNNGKRLQQNKFYEKAAAEYQLAITLDPAQIDARLNLGDCMLALERFLQARYHYSTAIEQFPNSARALIKMGDYFYTVNDRDQARNYYQLAIQKDPVNIKAYNNLAALEMKQKNYAGATELLRKVITIDASYSLAYLNLGVAAENSGDKKGALEAYHKYVDLGGEQAVEVRKWIAEMEQR